MNCWMRRIIWNFRSKRENKNSPARAAFVILRQNNNLMVWYPERNEKYAKYCMAVDRLDESIAAYEATPSDIIRDGIIQRFEFCTELAWKTAREYLLEEGVEFRNTPKAVMREAYAVGLIDEDALWSKLLTDRTLTSHTYNEDTAQEIFGCICTDYRRLFRGLAEALKEQ